MNNNNIVCKIEERATMYVKLQITQLGIYSWNVLIMPIYKNCEEGSIYEIEAYNRAIARIKDYFERNNYYYYTKTNDMVVSINISKMINRDRVFINKCKNIINSEFRYLNGYCIH